MYNKILVATDGSDLAERALDQAIGLAKLLGSELTIMTVTEPAVILGAGYSSVAGTSFDAVPELIEVNEKAARELLDKEVARAAGQGVTAKMAFVNDSFPAEGIVATAEQLGVDLIVMGSHGRRGLGRLLLGSQTSNVLAHTRIPVLVTR